MRLSQERIKAIKDAQAEIYMGGVSREDALALVETIYWYQAELTEQVRIKEQYQKERDNLLRTARTNPLTRLAESSEELLRRNAQRNTPPYYDPVNAARYRQMESPQLFSATGFPYAGPLYCSHCGNQIPIDTVTCKYCGWKR